MSAKSKKRILKKYLIGYTVLFIVCLFLPSKDGIRNFGIIVSIAVMGVSLIWLFLLRARKKGGGWEQQGLVISPAKGRKRVR